MQKKNKETYFPEVLSNGETLKQLLARSRYLLYKSEQKWTAEQKERAAMLFSRFGDMERAYRLSQELFWIFSATEDKIYAFTRLAKWADKVERAGYKSISTMSRTINIHHKKILNYFDNRSTNASAESFNAKIKAFRSQFRRVGDINFFLFRLTKLFA